MSRRPVPASSTVYTPDHVARAIVEALGDEPACEWLDPCAGDGVFVGEIVRLGVPTRRILALDLARGKAERDALARTERGIDFIAWASERPAVCDRVVMNPPYVALSKLRGAPRTAALAVLMPDGRRIALKANYWCAFVLTAMRMVRTNGSMAALLPAAWEYARYAHAVRQAVVDGFGEVTAIRSTSPLFPGVLEGAVVIIARKRTQQPNTFRRIEVPDAATAIRVLGDIAQGRAPKGATVVCAMRPARTEETQLNELIDVRIGGVTGDVRYFLLTEQQRNGLGLPKAALRPVLTRCRHLRSAFLTHEEWQKLLDSGERVWLFSPAGAILQHDAVRRYLRAGLRGNCEIGHYKIQARDPWYQTPIPSRADAFLSGMSKRLPFLVMREMSGLTATNTLYVVRFKKPIDIEARSALGISLLTSRVRKDLAARARIYADGLMKFEPAELGSVRIRLPEHRSNVRVVFEEATTLLLSGREQDAEALADAWVAGDLASACAATLSKERERAAAASRRRRKRPPS